MSHDDEKDRYKGTHYNMCPHPLLTNDGQRSEYCTHWACDVTGILGEVYEYNWNKFPHVAPDWHDKNEAHWDSYCKHMASEAEKYIEIMQQLMDDALAGKHPSLSTFATAYLKHGAEVYGQWGKQFGKAFLDHHKVLTAKFPKMEFAKIG